MASAVQRALERFARSSKLFALLDDAGVERLARAGELRSFGAGDVIVEQGEVGTEFYLISVGEVRVMVEEAGGEVARLGAGSFFGEIAVITRQPRTATVQCTEPSQLIRFEREPVVAILQDYPKVKEVLGGVGLMRSEENLQHVLGEGEVGLAEALEAEETEVALPDVGPVGPMAFDDDDPTVIDPGVNDAPWGGADDTVVDRRRARLRSETVTENAPLRESDLFGDAGDEEPG